VVAATVVDVAPVVGVAVETVKVVEGATTEGTVELSTLVILIPMQSPLSPPMPDGEKRHKDPKIIEGASEGDLTPDALT
jgi:hypothetical protein